jgi:hypothetical protein
MPVTAVAGESRCLNGQHRTRAAITDRNEQAFEAFSADSAAGATEVVIDDDDVLPSESFSSPLQGVLAAPTLGVVGELIGRGLSYIYVCASCEMIGGDLIHRVTPPRLRPIRTRSAVASGG